MFLCQQSMSLEVTYMLPVSSTSLLNVNYCNTHQLMQKQHNASQITFSQRPQ